jgi:hypothetical protein
MTRSGATDLLTGIDVSRLLTARLWVARLGESDVNSWWRTDGILGPDGAFVGPRLLPRTHPTARTRIAFAVAGHACLDRHPDREAMHLFRLTPEIEDRLDQLFVDRLGDASFWEPLMAGLETVTKESETAFALRQAGVVTDGDLTYVMKLKLGPAERSLPITASTPEDALRRLAAGYARCAPGKLVVPFLSREK